MIVDSYAREWFAQDPEMQMSKRNKKASEGGGEKERECWQGELTQCRGDTSVVGVRCGKNVDDLMV